MGQIHDRFALHAFPRKGHSTLTFAGTGCHTTADFRVLGRGSSMRYSSTALSATVFACCAASAWSQAAIIAGRLPDETVSKSRPAPRLPDGHPDLGNGKGSWNPRIIANLAGNGRGGRARSPVDKVIDVPFQPWAKAVYDQRQ